MAMLKSLMVRFRPQPPLEPAMAEFQQMMALAQGMVEEASAVLWGRPQSSEEKKALYAKDVQVNKLERAIRKRIVEYLTGPSPREIEHALLIMSVVKDVERIGDYAKNLMEVAEIAGGPWPEDDVVADFREIRHGVERLGRDASVAWAKTDRARAIELTRLGRELSRQCDVLVRKIANTEYTAPAAVALSLGTRFYKRIGAHFLNVLSGIFMPVHKLDFFDEDSILPEK